MTATIRPNDSAEAGLAIAQALEEAGISYALGGALALGAHGVPRGTLDVDVNVFCQEHEIPRIIERLRALGIELDTQAALARAHRDGMFVGRWADMRIDVFVPSIPFSREAEKTRVRLVDPAGQAAYFLTAESIAVFKLLFFRPKDIADLERLHAVQGPDLDRDYVRRWMVEMMGADDERVRTWDRITGTTP
jgi:hypothetical protein